MAKPTKDKSAPPPPPPPLRLEWIEAGSLAENPHNWRRHPEGQMSALSAVLDDPEIGWAGACLYNERTKRLIDGHARRKAVDAATPIPVLVGNWSEAAEKKILLTLDPLAGMASIDLGQLAALLKDVPLDDGLEALGDQLMEQLRNLPADIAEAEADAVKLAPVDTRRPPKMAWVLIGIPTVRFGTIAAMVEQVAALPGTVVETTVNDGGGGSQNR